jgi:adenylyltransferase/sulfurtransferase
MDALARYARQTILSEIGEPGQRRLLEAKAVVVGCGALGTGIANGLVRAGVGHVRVIDRDFVELNNLQRQVLFDEGDIAQGLPKAIAAAQKLQKINGQVTVEAVVKDVNPDNVEGLIGDADIVCDGADNFETRLLINDLCVKGDLPWVYGGVIGTSGMMMAILPHETPCFRCLVRHLPAPGHTPTCDTVGVLGPAAQIVASLQVTEALKVLTGQREALHRKLCCIDVWAGTLTQLALGKPEAPCPACDLGHFAFLTAEVGSQATTLCGRDAVQVDVRAAGQIPLASLADRLRAVGDVAFNEYMLRLAVDGYELNVFPDGRAIIKGCDDPALARTLYAKYIGA